MSAMYGLSSVMYGLSSVMYGKLSAKYGFRQISTVSRRGGSEKLVVGDVRHADRNLSSVMYGRRQISVVGDVRRRGDFCRRPSTELRQNLEFGEERGKR